MMTGRAAFLAGLALVAIVRSASAVPPPAPQPPSSSGGGLSQSAADGRYVQKGGDASGTSVTGGGQTRTMATISAAQLQDTAAAAAAQQTANGAVQANGGDASAVMAKATGATSSRTLAAISADELNAAALAAGALPTSGGTETGGVVFSGTGSPTGSPAPAATFSTQNQAIANGKALYIGNSYLSCTNGTQCQLVNDPLSVPAGLISGKPVIQTPSPGIALATITTPSAGTAPTGATQLTAAIGTITSCPSGSAAQLATAAGATQVYVNRCGASFPVYPVAGGTLGVQSANVPLLIDAGMQFTAMGLSATAETLSVAMNFEWIDLTPPFNIPPIPALSCASPISIAEAKAVVGDKIVATGTTSLPSSNIAVSFEVSVSSNGTIQIKPCNIANTGLAMSTAINGAVLSLLGIGTR